ncbi:SURF1 family protein [Aquimixticola soesokkakensis]|uniref:SURF1-like protein n=1 Tax=Aquimixticola soesokkakensis TaxID=1519096 RepID=A0A1Y5S3X3_9RHOB|nr:SURF1 family protein [Aquimixticola soesokkakensis]SLN32102.1 SURF1 family protein [Aquimixticola soesokkakensis]
MKRLLPAAIFGIVGFSILVSLGFWQLRRHYWKQGVLAQIEERIAQDPVALPAQPDPDADEYLAVVLEGTLEPQELHVLVSTRDLGAGFRIISPFVTQDGRRVMVDRGFVLTQARDSARVSGPMTITGNLHWPEERDSYTPQNDAVANYWYARDVPVMARALDTEPVLVIARGAIEPAMTPLPVSSEGIPNNHMGYVVQWFLFAAVWLGMTLLLLWRIRTKPV